LRVAFSELGTIVRRRVLTGFLTRNT